MSSQATDESKFDLKSRKKNPYLPHYSTTFELYRKLEERDIFLSEIDDRLKKKSQQNELNKMIKNLASITFKDQTENCNISPIKQWFIEIKRYDKEWILKKSSFSWKENRFFYDINYSQNDNCELLTFSSRFEGHCFRISMKDLNTKSKNNKFEIESSIALDGLLNYGSDALINGKTAREFVEHFVWKELKTLNNLFTPVPESLIVEKVNV